MSDLKQFKSSIRYRGSYSGTAVYYIGDTSLWTDGKVYHCKVNGTTAIAPSNTTNWELMVDTSTVQVATTGTGTNPATFTLTLSGNTVTLNKP